jgi:hypothetical protein
MTSESSDIVFAQLVGSGGPFTVNKWMREGKVSRAQCNMLRSVAERAMVPILLQRSIWLST